MPFLANPVRSSWVPGVLLLGVLGIFGGQAWLFFRGQTPVMALLQNEALVRSLVENQFGIDWDTWVSDPAIYQRIRNGIRACAWFFVLCALCSVALPLLRSEGRRRRWLRGTLAGVIFTGGAALMVLAWLSYLDHNEIAFHYLEYSAQVVTPAAWVFLLACSFRPAPWLGWVGRVALAFTFTVHGLYALGLVIPGSESMAWSLPGSWVEMTINAIGKVGATFGLAPPGEDLATGLLFHVGILDCLAAVAVLLPRVTKAALWYMAAWGLLTALARTWAHFQPEFAAETLVQWIPETMIRLPHFALPLVLLGVSSRPDETSSSDQPTSS